MPETRAVPFISRCPSKAQQRALRRETTRLVGRAQTEGGEKFFVSGVNDEYEVEIKTIPSCSCPDSDHPCKHLCFIYLDVLHVPVSSPIWWQEALLQSEVDAILPHRRSKRPSDAPLEGPSSKRLHVDNPQQQEEGDEDEDADGEDDDEIVEVEGPLTTSGIQLATVRSIILQATKTHPSCVKYIEALRPTVLDGLSEANIRLALLRIAQEHSDVATEIGHHRKEENKVVLSFARDVVEANWVIHSLDNLRESQKFERSHEVSGETDKIISRIVKKINTFSHPASRKNALEAILFIGGAMFNADGEIHKALVGYGDGLSEVVEGLTKIAGTMNRAEKAVILEDLKAFAERMDEYGQDGLHGLVEGIENEQ